MPRIPEEDKQERIEMAYELLASGLRPSQISEKMAEKFGCKRSYVRKSYLARAREMMVAEVKADKSEMRSRSLALYQSIIAEKETSPKDRLKAQERIDKLLGLELQERSHGEVNVYGDAIITTADRVSACREALDRELQRRRIGLPTPDTGNGDGGSGGSG